MARAVSSLIIPYCSITSCGTPICSLTLILYAVTPPMKCLELVGTSVMVLESSPPVTDSMTANVCWRAWRRAPTTFCKVSLPVPKMWTQYLPHLYLHLGHLSLGLLAGLCFGGNTHINGIGLG